MSGKVLSQRAINRATLARQLLLRRHELSALDAVHALAGLNGQMSEHPYIGLWARLVDFQQDQLADLLHSRQVVRSSLMRYTQHVVTADDYRMLRPVIQPILERVQRTAFGKQTEGVDLADLAKVGTELLRDKTLTRPQLGKMLAERWPGKDGSALAWSYQYVAPVVHPPPDGMWGRRGGATPFALAEDWLGGYSAAPVEPEKLVLLYLAAFGPATARDVSAWSGVSKLRDVVESLRPQLVAFRDEAGKELFDLPDAPRPDPETPAPPRFLPEFDNLVLAYADRSRVMTKEIQSQVCVGAGVAATLLVDGVVRGMWRVKQEDGTATLTVNLFEPLRDPEPVHEEGLRLLRFVAPDLRHDIQLRT